MNLPIPAHRAAVTPRPDPQISRHTAEAPSQIEIAHYLAQMTGEMTRIASNANLRLVAYFLDMARAECELRAEGHRPAGG